MQTIPKGYRVPEQPKLEAWHVEAIRRRIQEVLRTRCIFAPITLMLLEREADQKQVLELDSEPFNTVPVIHSEMNIETFGSHVYDGEQEMKDGTVEDVIRFYVGVHVRYEGNGVGLFTTSGQVQPKRERGSDYIFFDDERNENRRMIKGTVSRYDISDDVNDLKV